MRTPRVLLVVAGIVVGLAAALVAMLQCGTPRRPASTEAALAREASGPRAPSPTVRTPAPRPVLPPAPPASAVAAERPSARAETRIVVTQMKVQKYVDEAYPAWLRAHPGKECPGQLAELDEYMGSEDTKDGKDAWGRQLRMFCIEQPTGRKGLKVVSSGRDAQFLSEDDIKFGP